MKVLWAPWRMAFIASGKEPGCIFCTKPRHRDPRESLVLAVTPGSVVMLNKYPYNNAHLLIAPRTHTADLDELRPAERADLFDTLRASIRIVREALRPEGMNVGMNLGAVAGAGVLDHLHWHVVPRWKGDTNFMPVLASVRVMPQHLLESYDTLHPQFARLRRRRRRTR
ncbi:MAG: HIT family protein [Candidatus Binatia bacterium]